MLLLCTTMAGGRRSFSIIVSIDRETAVQTVHRREL